MNEINVNHGEPVRFKIDIGYAARIKINLFENGVDAVTTGWTWQFMVKKNPGDRLNVINLTLSNGISYEIYSDVTLVINLTAAQTLIEEGEYYVAIVRTDLPRKMIESTAYFGFKNQKA